MTRSADKQDPQVEFLKQRLGTLQEEKEGLDQNIANLQEKKVGIEQEIAEIQEQIDFSGLRHIRRPLSLSGLVALAALGKPLGGNVDASHGLACALLGIANL